MKKLSLALTITIPLVVGVLAFLILTGSLSSQGQGTLSGKVSIGPLCPVEPCKNPPSDIYSSRELILQPQYGQPIHLKLQSDGSFQATVNAGTYTVDLTNCLWPSCKTTPSTTVTIRPNETSILNISIDTGIR